MIHKRIELSIQFRFPQALPGMPMVPNRTFLPASPQMLSRHIHMDHLDPRHAVSRPALPRSCGPADLVPKRLVCPLHRVAGGPELLARSVLYGLNGGCGGEAGAGSAAGVSGRSGVRGDLWEAEGRAGATGGHVACARNRESWSRVREPEGPRAEPRGTGTWLLPVKRCIGLTQIDTGS